MDTLIIENVRCFQSPGPMPLAPLTLLIGENSTGKTTFLACARLAARMAQYMNTPDFNEEPFLLGAYEQIANFRGGRAGRAKMFQIGFERHGASTDSVDKDIPELRIIGGFCNERSQPLLAQLNIKTKQRDSFFVRKDQDDWDSEKIDFEEFLTDRSSAKYFMPVQTSTSKEKGKYVLLSQMHIPVYASAPIRSEPRRTYELLRDTINPSGGHVPMLLSQIYGSKQWERLKTALDGFGKASGLFSGIEVKRLGRQESSPFQVNIKIAGPSFNLIDVGYGVSQALPLVFDVIQGKPGTMFLLQQPEVHLHPRAQAELGTLLGAFAKADKKQFIVETHSDYLLDRVRMDVRDKKNLRPEDVSILYFERQAGEVVIHPMRLDERGNLLDVPAGYRRFSLDEERRFLGV